MMAWVFTKLLGVSLPNNYILHNWKILLREIQKPNGKTILERRPNKAHDSTLRQLKAS
jgi:hypothetical protein